jgi:hypothetical protein
MQKKGPVKKVFSAFLALLLLTSMPALAQIGLYFGLAGTVQSTWITNQNNYGLPDMDYLSTFGGGINLNAGYDFTNHLGMKIEFGYGKFGQRSSDYRVDSTFTRDSKLNYLMIPILFKYRTEGNIAKFYVAIGPQFNILLSANQKYLLNSYSYKDTLESVSGEKFQVGNEEIKERFSAMDIIARLDLGLNFTITKHIFVEVGLKLGYGLIDLNATDYRLKDHSGAYHPSHNVFGGLTAGLNYHL